MGLHYPLATQIYRWTCSTTTEVATALNADGTPAIMDEMINDISQPQVWWANFFDDDPTTTLSSDDNDFFFFFMTGAQKRGLFIACMSLGALLASHLVLFHLTHFSRRGELRAAAGLYAAGTLLQILSGSRGLLSPAAGFGLLLGGRTLFGAGIGLVMHAAPNYMAEMAPTAIRGAIVSAKESVIVLGIVFGYAVGDYVSTAASAANDDGNDEEDDALPNQWIALYQVSFLLSLPMLLLTFWVPRSVRWLLTEEQKLRHKGQCNNNHKLNDVDEDTDTERIANEMRREAKESLQFLYINDVSEELQQLSQQVATNHLMQLEQQQRHSQDGGHGGCGTTWSALLGDPMCRQPLGVALGIILLMEASGQPALLSYSTILFEQAGWSGYASVFNAVLMLCFSTLTIGLVDIVGRKRLLQCSAGLMGLALVILSVQAPYVWGTTIPRSESGFAVDDDEFDGTAQPFGPNDDGDDGIEQAAAVASWRQVMVLLAMFLYIGSYQLGFGPITWVVVAEVFPSHVRGKATALAVETKYILQFLVQFGVPILQQQLGWQITFGFFAASMAFAALVFIPSFVSETTGMTLEQIEAKTRQQCYAKKKLMSTQSTLMTESDEDDETSANTSTKSTGEDDLLVLSERTRLLQPMNTDDARLDLAL